MNGQLCDYSSSCPIAYEGCFEDTHHIYWPKKEYRTRLERDFRVLGENTVELCRRVHQDLHATEQPPQKPSVAEMQVAVRRSSGQAKMAS